MPNLQTAALQELCSLVRDNSDGRFRSLYAPEGQFIYRQGDQLANIWCLISGNVVLSTTNLDGREQACIVRGSGSIVGLDALHSGIATSDARVLNGGEFRIVAAQDVTQLIGEGAQPAFTAALLKEIATLNGEQQLRTGSARESWRGFSSLRQQPRLFSFVMLRKNYRRAGIRL